MAIIIDIKDAIRDAIYKHDSSVNFNFNEIQTVEFPYVFFYIPSFTLDKALDENYYRHLTLNCVVEYMKSDNNSSTDLWHYADTLSEALSFFKFADGHLRALNQSFRIVDDVLQFTFTLETYVKIKDSYELMQELDFTIKGD